MFAWWQPEQPERNEPLDPLAMPEAQALSRSEREMLLELVEVLSDERAAKGGFSISAVRRLSAADISPAGWESFKQSVTISELPDVQDLLDRFVSLTGRGLEPEAWALLPELVRKSLAQSMNPGDVLLWVEFFLPPEGSLSGPLPPEIIRYGIQLVQAGERQALQLELNSLNAIGRIFDRSKTATLLQAALLEVQEGQADGSIGPTGPLRQYVDMFLTAPLRPLHREVLLDFIEGNNERGASSAELREGFRAFFGPKLPGSDHRRIDDAWNAATLDALRHYLRERWRAEPLLNALLVLRTPVSGSRSPGNGDVRQLEQHLRTAEIKFEVVSEVLLHSIGTHGEILPPALTKAARAVDESAIRYFPAETAHTLKDTVYKTINHLSRLRADAHHFEEILSMARALRPIPGRDTPAEFENACRLFVKAVQLEPAQDLFDAIDEAYSQRPEERLRVRSAAEEYLTSNSNTSICPAAAQCLTAQVPRYAANNWDFRELLASWRPLDFTNDIAGLWGKIMRVSDVLFDHGIRPEGVSFQVARGFDSYTEHEQARYVHIARLVQGLADRHAPDDRPGIRRSADACWNALHSVDGIPHAYLLLERVLRLEKPPLPELTVVLERDLPMYALIQRRLTLASMPSLEHGGPSDREYREQMRALTLLENSLVTNDHPPHLIHDRYGDVTAEAETFYRETLQVYRRAYDVYNGFGALRFESQRLEDEPAALAAFGRDCAIRVSVVNAAAIDQFPGRGYLISGLLPEQIFAPDPDSRGPDGAPTFGLYQRAWPHLAEQFSDLERTSYLLTRGIIAVVPPADPRYEIAGTHYSYVIFNEHFENPWLDIAFLVPTPVLQEAVGGTLIPFEGYTGPSREFADITERDLSARSLRRACLEKGMNLLNLGWGSNHAGGLCNAFPPGSAPYHEWERSLFGRETLDGYRHVHKSHRFGGYQRHLSPEMDAFLQTLRDAHAEVRDLTGRCHNLLSLLQIAQAYWHRGYTLPRQFDDDSGTNFTIEVNFEEPFEPSKPLPDPLTARMLGQGHRWHRILTARDAEPEAYPVLVITDATRWSGAPDRLVLDTLDLRCFDGQRWHQLPVWGDGTEEFEQEVWQAVLRQTRELELRDGRVKDLRWVHRSTVRRFFGDS